MINEKRTGVGGLKLYIASDLQLHLEFGDCIIENKDNAEVLILAGDILVAKDLGIIDPKTQEETTESQRYKRFLTRVNSEFETVIYIMGNHEHYRGDFAKSKDRIQSTLDHSGLYNIRLLEKETVNLYGYQFICGTLWTDFNKNDALTLFHAQTGMNDYKGVKNTDKPDVWRFLPRHALEDHYRMRQYLETVLANRRERKADDKGVVVVGHHAPSSLSIAPEYLRDTIMNGCFMSNLEDIMLDNPDIKLWVHGHTHDDFDYTVGDCRVVCNPRGYVGHESRANWWEPKLIELE